ncbi:MAG: porin family protein [Candidatus Methylomirabilia bacterium]
MRLRWSGGALGAIAAGIVLIAGQASEVRAAFVYDVTLGADAQLDDNFHLDPATTVEEGAASAEGVAGAEGTPGLRQPVKETIFTVNPGVTVSWFEGRDRLQLNYGGAYSSYRGDEKRDPLWVHTIAADLSWRRWAPFFLEAQESRSRVPRTQEREGEAYVDQVDRNLISVRTGLVSEMGSRSTVELAYRGELESYSVSGGGVPATEGTDPGTEATEPVIDEFDRVERHFGEALLRHRWTPLWDSELRVAYGHVGRELAPAYSELRASLAVDQRWSERLSLRYHLDWIRDDDDKPAEAVAATGEAAIGSAATDAPVDTVRTNLLFGAEVRGTLERGGSWNLAYQDSLADQPDGDTLKTGRASAAATLRARLGSTLDVGGWHETRDFRDSGREEVAWGPTLGVRWLITPWAALDLGGSWTSTTIREEAQAEVEDRTARVAAGLVVLLVKRVQFEAGYGYRKNDSTDALRDYTNNLVFARLTFHFQPVESGRLPASYAAGLVAGGAPSGGAAQPIDNSAAGSVP